MLDAAEIGRRIKVLRILRDDTSREELANAINASVSAVTMYENGERIPRDEIKVKIAEFFGRTVQEIFFDEECHIT